jgi:UDP-N-acetylmuramate dehydrogenase
VSGATPSHAPVADGIELVGDATLGEDNASTAVPPNPQSLLQRAERRAELSALCRSGARFDEPMRRHTTLKIGGAADAFVAPADADELRAVIQWANAHALPLTVVGGGSNLLVRDGGIRGVVIATKGMRSIELPTPTTIRVAAGVSTGKLLATAVEHDLGGIEFLGGVPGSVGGGLIMNAGTYLGEFKSVVTSVTSVRLSDGGIVTRSNPECGFAYRHSDLPETEIVVGAELQLQPRPRAEIEAVVKDLRARRHDREPKKVSSNGSTFKNPPNDFAGRLIESAGCKGWREGDAECSPVHANWLVNNANATATQLLRLIERVRTRVHEFHGITLQLEVKLLGVDPA